MNYGDYRSHILICEFLGREPIGQYKEVHDFLTGLWEGMEIVVVTLTNRIVLQKQKQGKWFLEQDLKTGYLWCQDDMVWSFFRNDMGMESADTKDFIKSLVEEHLKCDVGRPSISFA